MSLTTTSGELLSAAGKVAPPLAVTGVTAVGISLQEWVLIATLIYTILQIGVLIYKFFTKDRRDGSERE